MLVLGSPCSACCLCSAISLPTSAADKPSGTLQLRSRSSRWTPPGRIEAARAAASPDPGDIGPLMRYAQCTRPQVISQDRSAVARRPNRARLRRLARDRAAVARALDRAGARSRSSRAPGGARSGGADCINGPLILAADLADPDAPARPWPKRATALGAIDVLVNNAALAARAPTDELDAALVDRLYAVNVRAPLLLIAALVPSMVEPGAARSSTSRRGRRWSAPRGARRTPRPRARSTGDAFAGDELVRWTGNSVAPAWSTRDVGAQLAYPA